MPSFGEQGLGFGFLSRIKNFVVGRTNMAAQNVQAATQMAQTQPGVQTILHFSPIGGGGAQRQANRQQLRPIAMISGGAPQTSYTAPYTPKY